MLHQVHRVLPWAKEVIGPSARRCLCIQNHILKDYVYGGWVNKSFLASGHSLKKISSKISCRRQPKKYPFNIRLNSDDPCPPCAPWIHNISGPGHSLLKISSKISSVATKKSVSSVCSVDYSECPPWIIQIALRGKIDLSALCTLAKISLVSTRLLGISMKAWKTNSLPTTSME